MSTIVSRLDVTQIFCDIDDFCSSWERMWKQVPQLPSMTGERRSNSRMHLSEVMTIARVLRTRCANAFHGSGYRTFKEFYTLHVLPGWRKAFPNLVSYSRFVELMPWSLILMCCFLNTLTGEITGRTLYRFHALLMFVITVGHIPIKSLKGWLDGVKIPWVGIMALNYI